MPRISGAALSHNLIRIGCARPDEKGPHAWWSRSALNPSPALFQGLLLAVALDEVALVLGQGEKLQPAPASPVAHGHVAHEGVRWYRQRNVQLHCDQVAQMQGFQAATASTNPVFRDTVAAYAKREDFAVANQVGDCGNIRLEPGETAVVRRV